MDFSNKDEIIKRMNIEEMKNKEEELTNILQQSFDMLAQGASQEEVSQAAIEQLQQMEQGKGLGSTSNSNNVQAAQQGANV
jgi:flagellar motor component MotA